MTTVLARRFAQKIVIMSDTMITERAGTRSSAIPGRLKSIVLDGTVSVAYAGWSTQAIDAIRTCKEARASGASLDELIDFLARATTQCDGLEFLLAAHNPLPVLLKIWAGRVSSPLDEAWLGNPAFRRAHDEAESLHRKQFSDFVLDDESAWVAGFADLFGPFSKIALPDGVGGMPMRLLGSPDGHCYGSYAGAYTWDVLDLVVGSTPIQVEDRLSGLTEWRYNLMGSRYRGAAAYGLYVAQASTGYLYTPLTHDDPLLFTDVSMTGFASVVDETAAAMPGAFLDPE